MNAPLLRMALIAAALTMAPTAFAGMIGGGQNSCLGANCQTDNMFPNGGGFGHYPQQPPTKPGGSQHEHHPGDGCDDDKVDVPEPGIFGLMLLAGGLAFSMRRKHR